MYFASVVPEPPEVAERLRFIKSDNRAPLPEDLLLFFRSIRLIELRLSNAFSSGETRTKLLTQLADIAKLGLASSTPNVALANSELDFFKGVVVREAHVLRERYLNQMLYACTWVVVSGILVIILWLMMQSRYAKLYPIFNNDNLVSNSVTLFGAFGFALIGIGVATCVASYMQNRDLNYINFDQIRKYYWEPHQYLLYIAMLCILFFVLLLSQILQVGIGNNLLNQVKTHSELGILVGITCGFSEPLIASLLTKGFSPAEHLVKEK